MVGWLKALLFVVGGVAAAAGTAYVTGLLDPWLAPDQPVIAAPVEPSAPQSQEQQQTPQASEESAPQQETTTADKQDRLVLPTFDVLRVEPDGSALIAGNAAPDASIQVLDGDTVLSSTTAGPEGDFVIVLKDALKPGNYQLSLRAISGDVIADSVETAVVSIPEKPDGQVLALVDTPDAPAELITVPGAAPQVAAAEPAKEDAAAAPVAAAQDAGGEQAPVAAQDEPAPQQDAVAEAPVAETQEPARAEEGIVPQTEIAAAPATEAPEAAPEQPATAERVVVEAVEIEGGTIFVAGHAAAGRVVRVYADDTLLGEARVSEAGRFLVETRRDLPVGNYLIRADLLDANGAVLARAAVPFEREPGEAIAAVAPAQPAAQDAAPQQPAIAAEKTETGTETAVAAAPALQRVDGAVIIRRGDSLWRISRRVYGRGVRYSTIYLANQDQIRDPDRIWPGQVFAVPQETPEGEEADMGAVADQVVEPEAQPAAQ